MKASLKHGSAGPPSKAIINEEEKEIEKKRISK